MLSQGYSLEILPQGGGHWGFQQLGWVQGEHG